MKQLFLILVCLGSLVSFPSFAAENASLDKIVAIVNDDVITHSELDHALTAIKFQIAQEQAPQPSEAALQKQVLDQLINKKLQLQMAKQAGISVSDDELNKAIERIASQNQISVESLYSHLNQDGMSTRDYRHEIHDQMVMQKLQQQEVVSHIVISPQEIDGFLRTQAWKNNSTTEYHLEDILIPLSDAPSPQDIGAAKKQADIIMTKLKNGANFNELAQKESQGSNALKGGDLGWRKLPEIPTAFVEPVTHLKANGLAGPIQTPNGFHIIRLTDTRAITEKQSAPDRKQIEQLLLQRKFEEAVQNWVSKLRSQAFITMPSDKHEYA